MATFRKIHTTFWSDSFVSGLDPEKKLFYIYILTNERTTQCGIYEITKRQMSFDTGYTIDRVSKLLEYFISCGKIRYNEKTNEIAIKNWVRYNGSTSPKVQSCVNKELTQIKDKVLIQYLYSMDTQTQEEEEEEEEIISTSVDSENLPDLSLPSISSENTHIKYTEIVNLYNSVCVSLPKVKKLTGSRKAKMKTRVNELKKQFPNRDYLKALNYLFGKMENSDFMRGNNPRNWTGDFDFLFENETNWVKVYEGKYDNKSAEKAKKPTIVD